MHGCEIDSQLAKLNRSVYLLGSSIKSEISMTQRQPSGNELMGLQNTEILRIDMKCLFLMIS